MFLEEFYFTTFCSSNNFTGRIQQAFADFMGRIMQGPVTFNPSQIILTAGATPAIETLSFCLADPGNAFLVPSPYYPG